jgi:poly-gamma-glutamate synthesis protein (capsule biosynthesis protein)
MEVRMKTAFLYLVFSLLIAGCVWADQSRFIALEDFESGAVSLTSWADEDNSPNSWYLDTVYTNAGSGYALKLTGNTWKQQTITPVSITSEHVFQVACRRSGNNARVQGIGFSNGLHTLFYSFAGTGEMNTEQWVTVYQGAFSSQNWQDYQLPIADDWYAYFDELPVINSVIYINDLDSGTGSVWFDDLRNISDDLPVAPIVTLSYNLGRQFSDNSGWRNVTVNFFSTVVDEDSSVFDYYWSFGDSTSSTEANPVHTFTCADDHPYTVALRVTDATGRYGMAACQVNVDAGLGSLPIRMNFVGDVMLARYYEQDNGIIPTQGVAAIFQPTKNLLGDAADITNANLEVVLTDQGTAHPTKSVVYRGNPNNVSGLVYAGIDVVSVANNHILDYGISGLQQMLGNLSANNIIYSGSGANSYEAYTPAFINKHGLNIGFLRSCDRTGQYNNAQPFLQAGYNKPGFALFTPYYLDEQIAAVDSVADLKIVEMHGGSEYSLAPGSDYDKNMPFADEVEDEEYAYYSDVPHQWDIEIRHHAIESGADMVIVHHPHILHGLEIYQGKLIAHSLGNFAFDLSYPETMPSMILYADADRNGFDNFQVVPCFIDRYIPRRASGKLGIRILDYLAKRSKDLNTYLLINTADVTAAVVADTTQLTFYDNLTSVQMPVKFLSTGVYATEPFKLSRSGSISSVDLTSPGNNNQVRLGQECIWMNNMEDEGSALWDVNQTSSYYDSVTRLEGNRSLKITASGQENTVSLRNKFKWYDNTKLYTVHAWIRTQNASNVNVVINYYNSRTSNYPTSSENLLSLPLSGANSWTFINKELTIPSNCSYYNISCVVGNGVAWFDEVGLIEWTPWQNTALLSSIATPNDYYWMQVKSSDNPKRLRISYSERSYMLVPPVGQDLSAEHLISKLTSYPNPFNPETRISFQTHTAARVTATVYNLKGQRVKVLMDDYLEQGQHNLSWQGTDANGKHCASGLYLCRISAGKSTQLHKLMLLK